MEPRGTSTQAWGGPSIVSRSGPELPKGSGLVSCQALRGAAWSPVASFSHACLPMRR